MKKLLLHIGTGKTGSTTLQKVLNQQHERGQLGGIEYPKIGDLTNHNELCTLVMPHDRIRRDIRSKYPKPNAKYHSYKKSIEKQLHDGLSQDKEFFTLSGEYFCGFNVDEVSEFKSILASLGFSEVKVVIYFRPPVELYLSQIQQRIKASSKFSNPKNYKFPYQDIYKRWQQYFTEIEVRSFKRTDLVGGDIVEDFYSVINNFFNVALEVPKSIEKTNETLTTAGMLIQHEYRKFIHPNEDNVFKKGSSRLLKAIMKAEKDSGFSDKPALQSWVKELIVTNNTSDIEWLRETFNIDFGYDLIESPMEKERQAVKGSLDNVLVIGDSIGERKSELTSRILKSLLE